MQYLGLVFNLRSISERVSIYTCYLMNATKLSLAHCTRKVNIWGKLKSVNLRPKCRKAPSLILIRSEKCYQSPSKPVYTQANISSASTKYPIEYTQTNIFFLRTHQDHNIGEIYNTTWLLYSSNIAVSRN